MPSLIDPTKPTAGAATTLSVRENFSAAKTEIETLQNDRAIAYPGDYPMLPMSLSNQTTRAIIALPLPYAISANTGTLAAARRFLIPFRAIAAGTLASLHARINTGTTGTQRLALYSPAASGFFRPGALIWDSGDITNAAAATVGGTLSRAVAVGDILFAAWQSSASISMHTFGAYTLPNAWPGHETALGPGAGALYQDTAYAAWPSDLSGVTWTLHSGSSPMMGYKYA